MSVAYANWFALEAEENSVQVTKKKVIKGDNVVSVKSIDERVFLVNFPNNISKYYCLKRNRVNL